MIERRPQIYLTDGEGPVVFKDLARDASNKYLPTNTFDIVSMWVAHDTEKNHPVFEPGDTLALIVPHLLVHGVTDQDMYFEAKSVTVAPGIADHIKAMKNSFSRVGIVSTAYEHLAKFYGPQVGIRDSDIASTKISLNDLRNEFISGSVIRAVLNAEDALKNLKEVVEVAINDFREGMSLNEIFGRDSTKPIDDVLCELYFSRLPRFDYPATDIVKVTGGDRKVDRIKEVVKEENAHLEDVVYVGDSITDDKAHQFVKENGGLSIAVNGDEFAIRNANVAIATEDMRGIKQITDAWQSGGLEKVRDLDSDNQFIGGKERVGECGSYMSEITIVKPENVKNIAKIHAKYRSSVRTSATPII